MRIVVDTNIWISAAITPDGYCAPLIDRLRAGDFTTIVTPSMMNELGVVLNRPRFARKYALTTETIGRLLALLRVRSEIVVDPPAVRVSRDLRDDIFVAVSRKYQADYLVTRDDDLKRDLNVLAYLEGRSEVVSVRTFLDLLNQPAT